mmetsp:Transcript_15071/g.33230  ORF Transcript_15071/g.33230 Transcript_15071/m.33230 type:complete len:268 (+) Transcript_15071:1692-2495(+)
MGKDTGAIAADTVPVPVCCRFLLYSRVGSGYSCDCDCGCCCGVSRDLAPEVAQGGGEGAVGAVVGGLWVLVHVGYVLEVGLAGHEGRGDVGEHGYLRLRVSHQIELLRLVVSHADEDGPGACCSQQVLLGVRSVARLLQYVPQHEDVRLAIVAARLQRFPVVGHPHLLGHPDARLRDARDDACEAWEGDGDEGVAPLGGVAVDSGDGVVGEGPAAEVEGAHLDEAALLGGLAPGTVGSAGHADEFRQHVELLQGGEPLSRVAVLVSR